MSTIRTFTDLYDHLRLTGRHARIAVARGTDHATQEALRMACERGLAETMNVDAETPEMAARQAVALVRRGEADVLMKGLVGTDHLLRAVLDKEGGLLPKGRVMTHLAAAEIPGHEKILMFTDAAVIPYPTQEQRVEQVRYAVRVCHNLGIGMPRIALTHCAEHGGKQFPFVDGYADIQRLAAQGEFGICLVDGPMDVKCACSRDALRAKGLESVLEGQADVLVMPDIEAGNTFYKTLTLFTSTKTAGVLCGTSVPVIVPSRGDEPESKYNSILLALAAMDVER